MAAPSTSESAIVTVRSKTLAKILRSYKDGKFILQDDQTTSTCTTPVEENIPACGPLLARLTHADLMLYELEPRNDTCPLNLTHMQPPTSQAEFELAQIILGTTIKNTRLRKLLVKAELGQTLSRLRKFQYDLADVTLPLLAQLDAFLESLRCVENVPAGEIKDGGVVQHVFTEELTEVAADEGEGEAEFLLWVERSEVDVEEVRVALRGAREDGYDAESEEKLAETVEALRRSGASEMGLRLKGMIKGVINALKV